MWKELLGQFLEEITLMSDADRDESVDHVKMMTIHASKWLEFARVYVVWLEEGTFPSTIDSELDDIEEERRLMYVAITRAKDSLVLSHAQTRRLYNKTLYCSASRFLAELPQDLVKTYSFASRPSKKILSHDFSIGDRVSSRLFGEWVIQDIRKDIAIVLLDKKIYGQRKIDVRLLQKI